MTKKSLLLALVILAVAGALLALIFNTEPEATRGGATKETAMLVDVVEAQRGSYRPQIQVMGTVEPVRDVVLAPRVSGEIVERSGAFTPGGFVPRGEVLVRLDPADYRTRLAQARADLEQAEADLKLEMGRQDIAREDYELLGRSLGEEDQGLVLRQPQLQTARAAVERARAAVDQAQLDLERTTVRAPFDAHILRRDVDVGSQVAAGVPLGRIVGVDTYWVVATVPLSKLRQIEIPSGSVDDGRRDTAGDDAAGDDAAGDDEAGALARVRDRAAWPEGVFREGRVHRLLGELAQNTRMARVLVTVDDPLARRARATSGSDPSSGSAQSSGSGGETVEVPPLMIGTFVEVLIEGEALDDVVRLDRDYVRQNDTVWVMENGELRLRDAEIAFRDARYAYLSSGVEAGEKVVTTNLSTVVEGAALRVEEE